MAERIRLFLVDGSVLLRRCLAAYLSQRRSLQVVGEAATGTDALDQARLLQPDIVLLEIEVSDGGPALVADLCRGIPGRAVMILTSCDESSAMSAALQAGAQAYLHKDCEPEDVVEAIQRVRRGEVVLASSLAAPIVKEAGEMLTREPDPSKLTSSLSLTHRELEVLRLVANGLTNQQIAQELFITGHTVKGHLTKISGKVGAGNRVQLTTYAVQHDLVEITMPEADT